MGLNRTPLQWQERLLIIVLLLAVAGIACGPSALAERRPVSGTESVILPEQAPSAATATPEPAPIRDETEAASNEVIFVTREEPESLNAWSEGCRGNLAGAVCNEIASDPLTWIDSRTFEVVPLAGVEEWSQVAPDRWRFTLREGVTFHNGEAWDAVAARIGLDLQGDPLTSGGGRRSFEFHGAISGEVVNGLTVDVVCQSACPMFPRAAIYTAFQAPEWWANAPEEEKAAKTVGLGPYMVKKYVPGVEVQLESYDGYQPNSANEAQGPTIGKARQVWRSEPLARAALIEAGEAHWAEDVGIENVWSVPVAVTGGTNEVLTLVADNIWHPELKKKGIRQALALAVDCELLMAVLYDGLQDCIGNISQWGTVGINDSNFSPYGYDPGRARELLADNGYDPENVIRIHTRADRVYRGLELFESVITMWEDVGVNAELVVLDPSRARDYRRSGCGQFEGEEAQLQCAANDPAPPVETSTHYYEAATSNDLLDMQRQLLLRTSCHSVNSRVCNLVPGLDGRTFQESIADAIATPMGVQRTGKMEELAQIIHDEHWFLPFFVTTQVYGLAEELEWEPRYDPRLRLNTMRFTR